MSKYGLWIGGLIAGGVFFGSILNIGGLGNIFWSSAFIVGAIYLREIILKKGLNKAFLLAPLVLVLFGAYHLLRTVGMYFDFSNLFKAIAVILLFGAYLLHRWILNKKFHQIYLFVPMLCGLLAGASMAITLPGLWFAWVYMSVIFGCMYYYSKFIHDRASSTTAYLASVFFAVALFGGGFLLWLAREGMLMQFFKEISR